MTADVVAYLAPYWRDRIEVTAFGCWRWTGGLHPRYGHPRGYSTQRRPGEAGSEVSPRRVLYEAFITPLAPGRALIQGCGDQRCVAPAHAVRRVGGPPPRRRGEAAVAR